MKLNTITLVEIMRKRILYILFIGFFIAAGCNSLSRGQKGAIIGTGGGAAVGAVIGEAAGNTALGAIVGATVGGAAGAIIGEQMDKQAEEMKEEVDGATIKRIGEGIVVEFNDNILFDFDSSELSQEAQNNLKKLADILQKYPDTDITIQGHTDSSGSEDYNQQLSERRALAVAHFIAEEGINGPRMTIIGFGETEPKYSNETDLGQSQNRRVEFLITANEEMIAEAKEKAHEN